MWTTRAPGAKTVVERREDLGEDVGADDQDGVGRRRPAACCGGRTCGRGCPRKSGWVSSMLTSDELAPHTSAPSSSATWVSSAWAPDIATPSPMMIIGRSAPARSVGRLVDQRRRPGRSAWPASTSATIGSVVRGRRGRPPAGRRRPGPVGARAGDLDRPAQDPQHRPRVARPASPTWSRAWPSRPGRRPSGRPSRRSAMPDSPAITTSGEPPRLAW